MYGSESNLIVAKMVSKNVEEQMNKEFTLTGSDEYNYVPPKKDKVGFKALVTCLVLAAFAGICLVQPPATQNTTSTGLNNQYARSHMGTLYL